MAAKKQKWSTVSLQPLTGQLDARFRPTETPDGGLKEKQNLAVSENGRLTRKCGFERLFAESVFLQGPYASQNLTGCIATAVLQGGQWWCPSYTNWDFHRRNVTTRKPITGLFEITGSDKARYLFATTESEISVLNETTGQWTDIYQGAITGGKFRCDMLQDTVVFTDRKNVILSFNLGGTQAVTISDLQNVGSDTPLTNAQVVIQYNGLMLLMNTVEGGVNHPNRVRNSDLNLPLSWLVEGAGGGSIANFQDLAAGEEILAAAVLQGSLIIYTNCSLWTCYISVDAAANTALGFGRIYTEPKNNAGCLVYPDSLVSTGDAHYYASRESFYTYNPYLPTPEAPEWLRQATGLIYTDKNRKIDPACCLAMCAEYRPLTHEMWISWPSAGNACLNNQSMIVSTKYLTGYYNDAGFTALTNYKPNPAAGADCNVLQILVAASSQDYALKQAGMVLFREFVAQTPRPGDETPLVSENITVPVWSTVGFNSILRGIVPVTLFDVEKIIRKVILGQYTAPQTTPCIARLRIGTSAQLTDPNNTTYCSIVWHTITPDLVLKCPETLTADELAADNLIPSLESEWNCYERGKYIYFEITVLNADGTPAIGAETHWFKIDFSVMSLPA